MRCLIGLFALTFCSLGANINMRVDDSAGVLGKVDVVTGAVTLVGSTGVVLTDIAFGPDGSLYGIDLGSLYKIDPDTAATTRIGSLAGASGTTNSLVFGQKWDAIYGQQ